MDPQEIKDDLWSKSPPQRSLISLLSCQQLILIPDTLVTRRGRLPHQLSNSVSFFMALQIVSLGITSFTLCALGIDRFHAATSSSQPKARRVARCRSVLLKLLLVWLAALLLSSPEIFLWQLSQAVSPSTGRLVDSCTITPASPLSLHLPDSLHSLLLRYHQVSSQVSSMSCLFDKGQCTMRITVLARI